MAVIFSEVNKQEFDICADDTIPLSYKKTPILLDTRIYSIIV